MRKLTEGKQEEGGDEGGECGENECFCPAAANESFSYEETERSGQKTEKNEMSKKQTSCLIENINAVLHHDCSTNKFEMNSTLQNMFSHLIVYSSLSVGIHWKHWLTLRL